MKKIFLAVFAAFLVNASVSADSVRDYFNNKEIWNLVPLRVIQQCIGAGALWKESAVDTAYAADNKVVSHFLDVGQGDCEFIELPNGECMLIDASIAEYGDFIVDYIKDLGYSDIDYLVATHPHADHIGAMTDVINSFDIGTFYMPDAVSESKTFERMLDAIEAEGCEVIEAKVGVNILTDADLSIDILAPVKNKYDNLNNYSAVIKLVYGDTSYLYTGDAEKEVEREILSADIEADVLKAGHHGSSTSSSSDFIRKVNPEYVVVSCGEDNSYGHPHDEVMSLYNTLGIQTFVTYETGTVVISSDSENITVENATAVSTGGIGSNDVRYASCGSDSSNTYVSYEEKQTQTEIVYKTNTGGKYHKAGCGYLKSKTEITLKDAVAEGLTPCSKCF